MKTKNAALRQDGFTIGFNFTSLTGWMKQQQAYKAESNNKGGTLPGRTGGHQPSGKYKCFLQFREDTPQGRGRVRGGAGVSDWQTGGRGALSKVSWR